MPLLSIQASTIAMPKLQLGNKEKKLIQSFSSHVDDLYREYKNLRAYNGNSVAATLRHTNKKSECIKRGKRMAAAAASVPDDLLSRLKKKG